jgi:hypothetical protein
MLSPKEFQNLYMSIYEARDDDAREMRRLAAAERRSGNSDRTDSKTASKYADSEKKSAEKADKKSKGKHIHGMTDSVEVDGDLVDESKDGSYDEPNMKKRQKNNEKAVEDMKKTKAHADMVKAASRHFEEFAAEAKNKEGKEQGADGKACWKGYKYAGTEKGKDNCVKSEEFELDERALDTAETGEKERLVKGMKKSAGDFKKRYGEKAKSVMYATATKMAKKNMDTSKSDRRYAVEETSMEESSDLENMKRSPRTPSQMAKREKLTNLINQIRTKKEGESK